MKKPEIVARAMSFVTLAIAGIMIVSIAKTSAWAGNKKEETKNIKTYYSYDVMKNINYKRDTSGLDKISLKNTEIAEVSQNTESTAVQEAQETQTPLKPAYTYTDVDAYKYAVVSLNIRNRPDTNGNVIGVLGEGEKVHVTAQCNETGWFKTDRGENAYVSGKYLSDEAPVPKPVKTEQAYENKQSSSQNTITDADFNDIIHAEGTVPISRLNALNNKLSIIPAGLINSFRNNGWKIVMTNRDIGDFLFNGAKGVCATTTTITNTMYFANTDHAVNVAVIHEFGHYMDVVITGTSDRSDFYDIYMSEKAALKNAFGFNRSDISNTKEFYASCLDAYYMNAGKMQQVAPQSYQIITEDLGKI